MARFNTRPGGDVMFGGTFNGNPLVVSAALATIEALEADDGAVYRHLYALGDRMREGLQAIADRLGYTARATSFGSVFVLYFTDRDVRSYDDCLTNDAETYVAFHRGMIDRGFLMPPMNLKRNHLTAAHAVQDVDRTLEAAEDTLRAIAAARVRPGSSVHSPVAAAVRSGGGAA
jgi:glutamate-1-semialdehyde 2,1-aminomutase